VKRFEFRLDKVLKLKEQRQRLAELRQQQAQLVVEGIRLEIANVQRELAAAAAALETHIGHAIAAGPWTALYEHSAQLGNLLRATEQRLGRALQELQTASALRTKITTEVEALLALRQQQWQTHWQGAMAAEQDLLEDQAMRRWHAARAADSRQRQPERE